MRVRVVLKQTKEWVICLMNYWRNSGRNDQKPEEFQLEKEEKLRATTKVGYQRDEIHNNGTITQYIFVTS